MKLKVIFYLLFCSISIQLFIACKDSKLNSIDSSPNQKDSILLKQLLFDAHQFIEKNHADSAKYFASKLLKIASKNQNYFYLGKGHAIYGYLNLIEQENDSSYFHLNKAKENFITINDSLNVAKNLTNMAIIQSNEGDEMGAEQIIIESLNFLNHAPEDSKLSLYNSLAISSRKQHSYKEAVYWYHKSLGVSKDDLNKRLCLNNLAISYRYLRSYKKADSILYILLNDHIVQKNPNLKSKVIDNLAYSRWKQNPNKNLEKEFKEALQIRIQNDDKWGQIASNAHLAEYFTNKKPATALLYAQKMYSIASELNSPDDRLEALQKLILLETPENAKKYAIRYASLNDSLVTARNQAKDQFAKIRYDTEKNREENQSLKIKDVENQLRIQRQKNTTIIALSGVGFLVLALISLYFQQKNKRKRERLIAAYESEVRMSKKVHDVVANDLHRFILRLQAILSSNHPEKEKLLSEIESIYQSSRDISHEFQALDKKDFNSEIRYLLSSYQSDSVKVIFNLLENEIWETVDELKKVEVFRVLQEIMTNMSKHSQADFVVIEFKKVENKIKIIYRDNGKGFSEDQLMKKSGIANTENRMESIKGSIIFDSNPGNGLIVTITFPI